MKVLDWLWLDQPRGDDSIVHLGISTIWEGTGARFLLNRDVERKPQQFYGPPDVALFPQVKTDPAAIRQNVMGHGAAGSYEFVSHLRRKWNIYESIAVNVADFAPAEQVFTSAEAMGKGRNTWPCQDLLFDTLPCVFHCKLQNRRGIPKKLQGNGIAL